MIWPSLRRLITWIYLAVSIGLWAYFELEALALRRRAEKLDKMLGP
jgi:hypothetical protein